jgi:O-antigen ligase
MLAHRSTRPFVLPTLAGGAALALAVLTFVPGLDVKVAERANNRGTLYDRQNLAHAAIGMVDARPLLGFGWASFQRRSEPFFEQNPNYPLTATDQIIHNLFLTYAAELGLVGLTLWAACLVCGVGSALVIRGPPSLALWRALLIAFGTMYLVVGNFVFPQVFPNVVMWLLAGIVMTARYGEPVAGAREPARHRPATAGFSAA